MTVSADEDVSFRVHIIGTEFNAVTWMKHDAQLELNDKYMYSTTGPDYTLYVNSVRWYDSGCYKCMVDGKRFVAKILLKIAFPALLIKSGKMPQLLLSLALI